MNRNGRSRVTVTFAGSIVAAAAIATLLATPPSGLTTTPIARATIAEPFKVHAKTNDVDVKLESKGPVDVVVNNNKLAPGGTVGWHSHTGPVIVQIRKGAMTLYGPDCVPHVVFAGEAFVENITGEHGHTVRNEGVEDLEWTGTSLIPVGAPGRVDQPAPATCPI
jgi:quercetin dioxygenase-like cupin family protein